MTTTFLTGEESLSKVVARSVPFELSDAETEALDATDRDEISVMAAITALFNKRTYTGWSSPGHTSVDVPLYVFGPGSERFHGVMQNEVVGQVLQSVFLPAI